MTVSQELVQNISSTASGSSLEQNYLSKLSLGGVSDPIKAYGCCFLMLCLEVHRELPLKILQGVREGWREKLWSHDTELSNIYLQCWNAQFSSPKTATMKQTIMQIDLMPKLRKRDNSVIN